jgi:hypothetical protein
MHMNLNEQQEELTYIMALKTFFMLWASSGGNELIVGSTTCSTNTRQAGSEYLHSTAGKPSSKDSSIIRRVYESMPHTGHSFRIRKLGSKYSEDARLGLCVLCSSWRLSRLRTPVELQTMSVT